MRAGFALTVDRLLCTALAWTLAAALAGCAGLPPQVQRAQSQAIAASPDTPLGRIAHASSPDPGLSGLRLISWPAQALHARIELVRRAQVSLDVQYYLIQNDETGRFFLRMLRDAAQRGVRVRLLIDDVYTAGNDPLLLALAAQPNIELRLFNPFPAGRNSLPARLMASLFDLGRVNHRMHNKLFIADGAIAIAGGRNIGNEYFMADQAANYIDLDTLVTGAVMPQLAALFDSYWNSPHVFALHTIVAPDAHPAELRSLFDELTAPPLAPEPAPLPPGAVDLLGQGALATELDAGKLQLVWARAEAFADLPDKVINHRAGGAQPSDESTVRFSLMNELRLARQEVFVSSPYIVPDRHVMEDIAEGRLWGLQIAILTNSLASTDEPLVHAGYQRWRHEMLDHGVELYEVVPSRVKRSSNLGPFGQSIGRFHAKAAVVDRKVVFIGSLNFDPRSHKHNTELGMFIRSPQLAEQLMKLADVVKAEAAYRLRLSPDRRQIEWHLKTPQGEQVLSQEPDTGFWQRTLLRLIAPLVPEALL
jgi:cardiolipin synthase C